jgi:hypothetical protein
MTGALFKDRRAGVLTAIVCAVGSLHACTAPDPGATQDAGEGVRPWVQAYEEA